MMMMLDGNFTLEVTVNLQSLYICLTIAIMLYKNAHPSKLVDVWRGFFQCCVFPAAISNRELKTRKQSLLDC